MKNSPSSSVVNRLNKITSSTSTIIDVAIAIFVALAIFATIYSSFFLSDGVMAFALSVVRDDSIQVNGNTRFSASGSTIMNYWIQQIGKDCDPTQSPTTVNINVPSSEVTATPNSLTFEICSKPQSVTFTSSKPGTYSITVTAPAGYETNSAAFTLYISGPATTKTIPGTSPTANHAPQPPTLYLPADKYVEAINSAGAIVPYTISAALDSLGHRIAPTCLPPSGSLFPLGKTTVICTAKDASGNTQSGSFEIIVQDTLPPDLSIPSTTITAEATAPRGTAVSYAVSASDLVSGNITPVCITTLSRTVVSSGSLFPLGKTTVICTAKDASGNTQSGSFEIIVQDTTPPTLTFAGSNLIAKAQSRTTAVSYSGYISASDLVDGSVTPTCLPPSGSLFPVGATTVKCTVTDRHGNAVSESFTMTVRYPTFSGFLPPIHSDGSSIFKLGSIIPVKFQLKWPNGGYVSDAVVQIYNAKVSNSITGRSMENDVSLPSSSSSGAASTSNYFTYDSSKQEYTYNLQTKDLSVGTWQIKILLDDGSSPSLTYSLR